MTTNLRVYCRSNNLGVRATIDLYDDLGYIRILCVSYCNLNKITRWFKYPYWRFNNVIIHPGKAKYGITKGESQSFVCKLQSCLSLRTRNKTDHEIVFNIILIRL